MLYSRWEANPWSAAEIDFTQDREDWQTKFTDFERQAALWHYTLFLHGEDLVTDALTAYIDAAPREEQKYFLATQLVDEARHSVFFMRFMQEVVGASGDYAKLMSDSEARLTWGFRKVFERLQRTVDALRADPSPVNFARALTIYHFMIEASMGLPSQLLIGRYLEERDVMPGFRAGMANVERDEHRHIAFGVKALGETVRDHPECRAAVADQIRLTNREAMASLKPPGWDLRYTEVFGYTLEELYSEGSRSLDARLRSAGLAPETLPGVPPLPTDMDPDERAAFGLRLLRAGLLGPKDGPPPNDAQSVAVVFDALRRNVNPNLQVRTPTVIAWDFSDADSWHLRLSPSSDPRVERGLPAGDDALILRCQYSDWLDVMAERVDPLRLILKRRLRPSGKISVLRQLPSIFAAA